MSIPNFSFTTGIDHFTAFSMGSWELAKTFKVTPSNRFSAAKAGTIAINKTLMTIKLRTMILFIPAFLLKKSSYHSSPSLSESKGFNHYRILTSKPPFNSMEFIITKKFNN